MWPWVRNRKGKKGKKEYFLGFLHSSFGERSCYLGAVKDAKCTGLVRFLVLRFIITMKCTERKLERLVRHFLIRCLGMREHIFCPRVFVVVGLNEIEINFQSAFLFALSLLFYIVSLQPAIFSLSVQKYKKKNRGSAVLVEIGKRWTWKKKIMKEVGMYFPPFVMKKENPSLSPEKMSPSRVHLWCGASWFRWKWNRLFLNVMFKTRLPGWSCQWYMLVSRTKPCKCKYK